MFQGTSSTMSSQEILEQLQIISGRLAVIEGNLGINSDSTSSVPQSKTVVKLPRSVVAFDSYVSRNVSPFVDACNKLGGDAAALGLFTKDSFEELRKLILMATVCSEPQQSVLSQVLSGLQGKMKEIAGSVQRNSWEKHGKTVAEGLGCLNWVCVKPAPCDFIESFIGGSDYWANNIRKEYRTTNPDHIAFCDTFKNLIKELINYVREFHTTGLAWKPNGIDVSAYKSDDSQPPSTPQQTVPTPTATTPTASADAKAAQSSTGQSETKVNIFAALNKGEGITAGLNRVTRDQQTWRSEYKATTEAPVVSTTAKPSTGKQETVKGPAKIEFLEGPFKWMVENQTAENGVVTITIGNIKETVYIIGCINATINVIGKCKSIILDTCKKTRVYFDIVMASCEVVNSQRIHIECRDKVSSVAIDKTDGIVVQLPKSSLDTSIVASKSSEMNLSWPDESGDLIERPIPEQYVHRINGTSITAEVSDLYGH